MNFWTLNEVQWVVAHEQGHYLRWHIELKLGVQGAILLATLAWWPAIALYSLTPLWSLAIEHDADRWAQARGANIRSVIESMLKLRFSWYGRLQLRLRLALLK